MSENIYGFEFNDDLVSQGAHRAAIGGLWDELGKLQLNFLIDRGLRPSDVLLDVGCGCLRGGVHFISYLEQKNYFGFDINQSLLDAGYDVELNKMGLQSKLPKNHLQANSCFDMTAFGQKFRYAIAFSLFTHLTLNSIRRCLIEMGRVMQPGAKFYATVFLCTDEDALERPCSQSAEITSFMDKDPYHYHLSDMRWLASQTSFDVSLIESFKHPRNQKMLEFVCK